MCIKSLKVVISERDTMGNVLFCIIFPQFLAFFIKHVLRFTSRENSRDQQALIIRVRRQLWQQRDHGHFYFLALHWLPSLVSGQGHETWFQKSEVGEEQSLAVAGVSSQTQKKREWTWGLPHVGFFIFISSLFLDMYPFQLNRLKILCSWAWADQMLHQGDSHKNTISALSQYASKLVSKI